MPESKHQTSTNDEHQASDESPTTELSTYEETVTEDEDFNLINYLALHS